MRGQSVGIFPVRNSSPEPVITEIDVCIHDGFVVFDNLRASKYFVYYTLKSIEGDWARHGQTGSQMNLNTSLIKRTEITMPPTAEQIAIAAVLSDMDAEVAALEEKLAKARALDAFEKLFRNDLVCINVRAIKRRDNACQTAKWFHLSPP